MKKVGTLQDYFDTVGIIAGEMVFLGDEIDGKCFSIRHDIDRVINDSVRMAEAEADRGIGATYFIHTNRFPVEQSWRKLLQIQNLGHRIGYHNDAVARWIELGADISETIRRPVEYLRDKGIEMRGAASHGSYMDTLNICCWKEFDGDLGMWATDFAICRDGKFDGSMDIPKVSLSDFGFEYEAYLLPFTHYASDCNPHLIDAAICDFNEAIGGNLQFLTHPDLWQ